MADIVAFRDNVEEIVEMLAQMPPKEILEQKKGPWDNEKKEYVMLTYLPGWWYLKRLNEVFGYFGWTMTTTDVRYWPEKSMVTCIVTIDFPYIDSKGFSLTRSSPGVSIVSDSNNKQLLTNAVKEAETVGMKRALRCWNTFGAGLYEGDSIDDYPDEEPAATMASKAPVVPQEASKTYKGVNTQGPGFKKPDSGKPDYQTVQIKFKNVQGTVEQVAEEKPDTLVWILGNFKLTDDRWQASLHYALDKNPLIVQTALQSCPEEMGEQKAALQKEVDKLAGNKGSPFDEETEEESFSSPDASKPAMVSGKDGTQEIPGAGCEYDPGTKTFRFDSGAIKGFADAVPGPMTKTLTEKLFGYIGKPITIEIMHSAYGITLSEDWDLGQIVDVLRQNLKMYQLVELRSVMAGGAYRYFTPSLPSKLDEALNIKGILL